MQGGRWKNWRDYEAAASTASISRGTSSTGWCGSRVRLKTYRYRAELFHDEPVPHGLGCVAGNISALRANKRYLEILELAAKEGEVRVDEALRSLLEMGESGEGKLNADTVQSLLLAGDMPLPATSIDIVEVSLSSFDELLCGTGSVAMSTPAPGLNPESGKQLNREYLLERCAYQRSVARSERKRRWAEAEKSLSYEQIS